MITNISNKISAAGFLSDLNRGDCTAELYSSGSKLFIEYYGMTIQLGPFYSLEVYVVKGLEPGDPWRVRMGQYDNSTEIQFEGTNNHCTTAQYAQELERQLYWASRYDADDPAAVESDIIMAARQTTPVIVHGTALYSLPVSGFAIWVAEGIHQIFEIRSQAVRAIQDAHRSS